MIKPKLLIFSSGTKEGGGSGFENLVLKAQEGILQADIVGVVSNNEFGGVREKADRLKIPFFHFPKPWTAEGYRELALKTEAEFFSLSGWLKKVIGLDPRRTINIHPGPLPEFGGNGMYGHHVHEAVMNAYRQGKLSHSAVSMHFVTPNYDEGPLFFRFNVKIKSDDTPETLGKRVNQFEHRFQPEITNLVVNGHIYWDGINPKSLVFPSDYQINRFE